MTTFRILIIFASCLTLLYACGGGGNSNGGTDGDNNSATTPCSTLNPSDTDTDGEGLPDCYEIFLGTSPANRDSDGDGLDDFEEVVTKAFDASINNFQFNPRIADVPKISVQLTSVPDFNINFTSTTSGSQTRSLTSGNRTTTTLTRGHTYEQSVGEELSSTLGSSGGTSGFDISSSTTYSQNRQETMSWSTTQSQENSAFRQSTQSETTEKGVTETGGELSAFLEVTNRGYQVITLNSLSVTASQIDPNNPDQRELVGGMNIDAENAFPFEINQNDSSNPLPFKAELTLPKIYALLENSRNLSIEPTTWQILDEDGRSYTHNLTNVHALSAQIVIDYDNVNNREIETHYVATVTDFGENRISAATALGNIIRATYSEGSSSSSYSGEYSGLISVRDVANNDSINGRWVAVHNYLDSDGITRLKTTYDIERGNYSLNDISLAKNETLLLMYYKDEDGDGLGSREEYLHGTFDNDSDSDNDNLTDFEEIKEGWEIPVTRTLTRTVYSNPLLEDADNDGLLDGLEKTMGSHPNKRDTDNDGVLDSSDSEITVADMQESAYLPLGSDNLNDTTLNQSLNTSGTYEFTTDRNGTADAAVEFTEDLHELTINNAFSDDVSNGASLVFWVKVDPNLPNNGWSLYENQYAPDNAQQFFWVYPSGFTVFGDRGDRHSIFTSQNTLFSSVSFANWHMIAIVGEEDAVNEGMKTFRVYYDGQIYGEVSHPTTLVEFDTDSPWIFAGTTSYNVGLDEFRGAIDDMRFFHRALDDEEIQLLYE